MNQVKLKAAIISKYGTVTSFAKHMGWRQNTLYKVIHNKRNLTVRELAGIAELLDLTPQEFYDIFADTRSR